MVLENKQKCKKEKYAPSIFIEWTMTLYRLAEWPRYNNLLCSKHLFQLTLPHKMQGTTEWPLRTTSNVFRVSWIYLLIFR